MPPHPPSGHQSWSIARAIVVGIILPAFALRAQAPTLEPVRQSPPWGQVALYNSHEYRVRSRINGQEYRIQVALPPRYNDSSTSDSTRHPVMYVLDGELELPLMAQMFRLSNGGTDGTGATIDRAPEQVIFVGIGTVPFGPVPAPNMQDRVRDYSPPPFPGPKPEHRNRQSEQPPAGGAPAFLRVMKEEVIPLIDKRYRTTADRGIHGHSLGGLFVAYALFTDPEVFSRYAITSPALWWDDASIFLRESELANRATSLRKRVFLSVGALEGADEIADVWRMLSTLCHDRAADRFAGLQLTAEILPGEYHGSVVHFSRALKALYPPFRADSVLMVDPCSGR